ncbi:MAG: hypothetical protein LBV44_01705 [Methylobacillus sp.]|jgi:hypothetical protein|nr:hypothetical protein [Methylobacillus sp.]
MKKIRHLLLAFLLSGGAMLFAAPTQAADDVEIVSSSFGLFYDLDSDNPAFVPTNLVPLTPKQSYGWIIQVSTDKPQIKWREEFTLPAKPETWGIDDSTSRTSADGLTTTTERTVAAEDGILYNVWDVAPGDPKGHYVMRVFVDDKLAATFEFDVQ